MYPFGMFTDMSSLFLPQSVTFHHVQTDFAPGIFISEYQEMKSNLGHLEVIYNTKPKVPVCMILPRHSTLVS